ncbi:MAG: PAS domain S-box protein [Proteobacteria bacterium]|nr:PAS domain S-box protein [Pseudomonadota bacterium]MBU1059850.1 PAS domain S-box protein [Pseudomonadota bacterium]
MKINQKLISGFFVSSLLILSVTYICVTLQERLTTDFQEIAGEVLPGTIALLHMDAELYHSLVSAAEYTATGDIEVKKSVELMIADLSKYLTIHKLLHAGHDSPEHMVVIEEKIDTFVNFITEYILLKDKGGTEKELNIVKKKIYRTVDDFRLLADPFIKEHIEDSRRTVKIAKKNIIHTRNLVLIFSTLILILSVILAFFISRLISRPILKLTEAAAQIGKGSLDTKIEIQSKDEIGELADSFNKMVKNLHMITVSRDTFALEVVERKKAEQALLKERDNAQKYLDVAGVMLVVINADGKVTHINKKGCQILGYDEKEIIGKNFFDNFLPEAMKNEVSRIFSQIIDGESEVGEYFENPVVTKSGKERIIAWHNTLLKNENGNKHATLSSGEDITERKRAEEEKEKIQAQLLQAQKMEAIGTLAGGIAHDFNNILQAIFGYVQLLLMKKAENDPDIRYLNEINRSAHRASELTKELLIFSRKMESILRPVNLNQEIDQVYKILQRTIPKMIAIELHLAEDIKIFNGDPIQLEQVMMNIAVNANYAMPDGGKIVFETRNVVLDERDGNAHAGAASGEYVQLTISDTGCGMDKETLGHIFEPFYTTKEIGKGTGLGLAMVYGIVRNHGGHIIVYSEPGHGTVFKIYYPVLDEGNIEQETGPEEEAEIRGGHETILLVDDEEPILDIGQEMLRAYGYTTITAESGEKAIEIYKREKNRIDLVIMDLGMPMMGGHKCLTELLRIDPEIKVIIASGYTSSDKITEALKGGAAAFVGKPYHLRDMLNKTRELLD